MRNREAERYARWAAITAGLIALAVVGVYAKRDLRQVRALRALPATVAMGVQQQSANFTYSNSDAQGRTTFTIRASHATQFKNENRALLQDVWITIYGREGNRNDNIHTRECNYEPQTGAIRCQGEVQIDISNTSPKDAKSASASESSLDVTTSNLTFNRNTGEASTPAPVEFRFPTGHGSGIGIAYSTRDSVVRLEQSVQFELTPSAGTDGLPVNASGSSLEIRRNEHILVLRGPATAREGMRELSADTISVELDANYRAKRAVAEGHPQIRAMEGRANINVSAIQFEALLNPTGGLERVIADGNIVGTRQSAAGTDRFTAAHTEFTMLPEHDLIREMTATGGVTAESHQGADSRLLKTDALRVTFSSDSAGKGRGLAANPQKVESAETLASATIESKTSGDTTTLKAEKFVAQLGPDGRLGKLLGHGAVEIHRQAGAGVPQTTSASELVATFGPGGDWNTLDESGSVRIQQADRAATADHANIVRVNDTVTLDGSPVITDSMSRTTAANVTINQKSGELRATGGVTSTYTPTAKADPVTIGTGAAHVSADALSGSAASSHVTYAGHARFWQGDSVLDADQIDLWRDDKKLQAEGHVVAVFPQDSGPFPSVPGEPSTPKSGPTLWRIVAPRLVYWSEQGKAHLDGGVIANSSQGSVESRSLDVFLDPTTSSLGSAGGPPSKTQGPAQVSGLPGGGQLNRVLALGSVVVRQGDRRGIADQAEYTAADGKFVLSGGQPTLFDAASDTTSGHSLTFFVANDTILIDSQEGSRTMTKHRVEK